MPSPVPGHPAADGSTLRVAVLGLGEAGSIFAAGIAAGPADVRGFDPADVAAPAGVSVADSPATAVAGADVTIALTHAAQAMEAAD